MKYYYRFCIRAAHTLEGDNLIVSRDFHSLREARAELPYFVMAFGRCEIVRRRYYYY